MKLDNVITSSIYLVVVLFGRRTVKTQPIILMSLDGIAADNERVGKRPLKPPHEAWTGRHCYTDASTLGRRSLVGAFAAFGYLKILTFFIMTKYYCVIP